VQYRRPLILERSTMNIWQAKLATGFGTIVLGLSASVFVQEQELPNKALLATEINDATMAASITRHRSATTVGTQWGRILEALPRGSLLGNFRQAIPDFAVRGPGIAKSAY
jgi:hypothetical protein